MDQEQISTIFKDLTNLPGETSWVEFKEAKEHYDFSKIGKYFSALSNEANLSDQKFGWLIFGVENRKHKITGSRYRINRIDLDSLKHEIAEKTGNRLTFLEIHELERPEGRVILFQIPAAPPGIPVSWEGHYYGREGESLSPLSLSEIEQIRGQTKPDWSAQICAGAAIDDLDLQAVAKARIEYRNKFPAKAQEVDGWDDRTFLNKAKITVQDKITRTAIILLGKPESEHFISPSIAKISWILKDGHGQEKDYAHLGPPFILNTDLVLAKIRNLNYRYLPDNTLFPVELTQYDTWVMREALHNCIAHQNYELCSKINVVEKPDELLFDNAGNFILGSVEAVIAQDSPQRYYRNRFLADAMGNLNMIDTVGGGIKKMFVVQKERHFPMPTYNLDKPDEVTVYLPGKIIDENYTKLLMRKTDIDLSKVLLLDKVQKGCQITKNEYYTLKAEKLAEGRYPKLFISSVIAAATEAKARYVRNRGLDKGYYKKIIIDLINKFGSAKRTDINSLLIEKLPDILSAAQKNKKIDNLIYELSKIEATIVNTGTRKNPKWTMRN